MNTNNNSLKLSLPIGQIIKEINWPLLASISLHGLFFTTIFPQWYSQNKSINADSLKNTPVIELNSLEQTRLPNLNPPNSFNWDSLNPLPEGTNLEGLTIPLPPLENNNFDLPETTNNTIYNDFSALPPPSPMTGNNFSPPPMVAGNFSPPPIPQITYQFDSSNTSSVDLPPPPPLNQDSLANLPPISETKINDIDEPDNPDTSSPFQQNKPINQILDEERQAEIRRQLFANSPIEITVNPRDVINNRDNKVDLKNNSLAMAGNDNQTISETPLPNLTEKLAKNTENTTDEEARKNYIAWAKEVENVSPQQVTLAGIYPKDACAKKIEGTTTYGITVNPAGNVVNSQLIKSSGYSLLNEQALRQITARQFENNTNTNVPYHVYVNFQYDSKICPSISLSNLGETPSSPSTNVLPPSPNPEQVKPEKPAVINSTKEPEQKANPQPVKQPSRVDNLATPEQNSAEGLKTPSQEVKKPDVSPPSPPVIEATPNKESEEKNSSARETINPPANSSPPSEKTSAESNAKEVEAVTENNSQDSPAPVDKAE